MMKNKKNMIGPRCNLQEQKLCWKVIEVRKRLLGMGVGVGVGGKWKE